MRKRKTTVKIAVRERLDEGYSANIQLPLAGETISCVQWAKVCEMQPETEKVCGETDIKARRTGGRTGGHREVLPR